MDIENLDKLIRAVTDEVPSVGFNMSYYLVRSSANPCGTVACLAGHCYILKHTEQTPVELADGVALEEVSNFDVLDEAADWLGITQWQASELFFAQQMVYERHVPMEGITRESALRTLLHLKETGEIKWFKSGD